MLRPICMTRNIFYLFIFLLSSCINSKEDDLSAIPKISVDIKDSSVLMFSSLFDSVDYTILETKEAFLIGDVDRMKIANDKLYILTSKRIVSFDLNTGESFFNIKKLGYSGEDYISLYDMNIDDYSKQIELLDMNGKKVKIYGFGGDFISEISLPFSSFAFIKLGENDYWFCNSNIASKYSDCQLIHYDIKNKKVLNDFFAIDSHLAKYYYVVEGNNFNLYSKVTFYSCPSNVIYQIKDNKSVLPLFRIDFGENQPPVSFFNQDFYDIADFADKANRLGYIYFVNNLVENDNYMAFSYRFEKKPYWSFVDKNVLSVYTCDKFVDDVNQFDYKFQIEYNNSPFAINGDKFYFILQPFQLLEAFNVLKDEIGDVKFDEFLNKSIDLKRIVEMTDFDDQSNPILVTCKFKNK